MENTAIKTMVLDVLMPNLLSPPNFSVYLAELEGLEEVNVTLVVMYERTQSLKVIISGYCINYEALKEHMGTQGAVIHSVNQVMQKEKTMRARPRLASVLLQNNVYPPCGDYRRDPKVQRKARKNRRAFKCINKTKIMNGDHKQTEASELLKNHIHLRFTPDITARANCACVFIGHAFHRGIYNSPWHRS